MKTRQSNLELFRIILMIGIVFGHGFRWGGIQSNLSFPSTLYCVVKILDIIDTPSVNCFAILSGYFLVTANFRISKIIKLWIQILFYSVSLYCLLVVSGLISFSFKDAGLSCIPVISNRYWFATNYVALYMLFPFINRVVRSMNKRQYQVLLAIELFLFSIVAMIPGVSGFNSLGGNSLIWLVVLYTIGGYLRKYPSNVPTRKLIMRYVAMIFLMFVLSETVMTVTQHFTGERQAGTRITGYTSILCVYTCVLCFQIFEGLRISEKAGALINRISPSCFGVYLIHEHPSVRHVLWGAIGLGNYANQWWLPFGMILEAVLVFISCSLIEYARQKLFDLIPKKTWSRMDKKFKSIIRCEV